MPDGAARRAHRHSARVLLRSAARRRPRRARKGEAAGAAAADSTISQTDGRRDRGPEARRRRHRRSRQPADGARPRSGAELDSRSASARASNNAKGRDDELHGRPQVRDEARLQRLPGHARCRRAGEVARGVARVQHGARARGRDQVRPEQSRHLGRNRPRRRQRPRYDADRARDVALAGDRGFKAAIEEHIVSTR